MFLSGVDQPAERSVRLVDPHHIRLTHSRRDAQPIPSRLTGFLPLAEPGLDAVSKARGTALRHCPAAVVAGFDVDRDP
jgi:hypothetical protein